MPNPISSQTAQSTRQASETETFEQAEKAPQAQAGKKSAAQKLKDSFETDPEKQWPSVSGLAARFDRGQVHNAQQSGTKDEAISNEQNFKQAHAFWSAGAKTQNDDE